MRHGLKAVVDWGSNAGTANAMMLSQLFAREIKDEAPAKASALRCMAQDQISALLGGNADGFSYMVGYGSKYPRQAHHRGASCPLPLDAPCGWDQFNSPSANPNVLSGSLVSGPDFSGFYQDKRSDYQHNEPALNYNAGIIGALAALRSSANQC